MYFNLELLHHVWNFADHVQHVDWVSKTMKTSMYTTMPPS